MSSDSVTEYENHAVEFLRRRDQSTIGVDIVRRWAETLESGTDTLEIACGGGIPITRALLDSGLNVSAMDSSPTLVAAFRDRFPDTPVVCERVQQSDFFERRFGAVVAIGLLFLLDEADQLSLIRRVARLLRPGGRFMFTAPVQTGVWRDCLTGGESTSLGRERYEAALMDAGFRLVGRYEDEGSNHHYDAELRA